MQSVDLWIMSNRDHERESLTRQIFVRPQSSDAPGDSSQEATRSLSLEELQEMGRQSKSDDYSAPTTQFTPSGPGAYGPSIQSQHSQQQQGTPQQSFPSPPAQPPQPPPQQTPPQQSFPSPPAQPPQTPPQQSQPQQPQPQAYPHAEPTKKKRKVPGVAIAMMVIAVVVALGICGYIVVDQLQRSDGNTQTANQPGGDGGSIGEGEDESGDTGESDEEADEEAGGAEESQDAEAKDVKAFMAPSSNIVCTIDADRARCTIREFDFDPGDAPDQCDVDPFGSVVVVEKDGAGFSCVNRGLPTEANVLDYGESISAHGFTCRSGEDGMTCEHSEGHKFRVARAAVNFD